MDIRNSSTGLKGLVEETSGAAHVLVAGGYAGPENEVSEGQTVAVGAASAASAVIAGTVVDVIFIPDAATTLGCFIQIATAPVAVANDDYYIASNTTYRFPITTGNKIACIQSAAAGDIYIHPVS